MATITVQYQHLQFQEPERISEAQFLHIKNQMEGEGNFKIAHTGILFFRFCKQPIIQLLIFTGITVVIWFYGIDIDKDKQSWFTENILPVFLIIFGLLAIYEYYVFIAQSSSYAKYNRDFSKYYKRMKKSVVNSNSYQDFVVSFYN